MRVSNLNPSGVASHSTVIQYHLTFFIIQTNACLTLYKKMLVWRKWDETRLFEHGNMRFVLCYVSKKMKFTSALKIWIKSIELITINKVCPRKRKKSMLPEGISQTSWNQQETRRNLSKISRNSCETKTNPRHACWWFQRPHCVVLFWFANCHACIYPDCVNFAMTFIQIRTC
jgi:hypothetical protein